MEPSLVVKIVLYGMAGVGKSALLVKYIYGKFDADIESTIGAAFNTKKVEVDKTTLALQIWDTAGSERFNSLMPMYVRGAKIVLLCFDEPNLEDIKTRIVKIFETNSQALVILVATKMDYLTDHSYRNDGYAEIALFAAQHGYKLFYTSSLSGYGVSELFDYVEQEGLKAARAHSLEQEPKSAPLDENKSPHWCCAS